MNAPERDSDVDPRRGANRDEPLPFESTPRASQHRGMVVFRVGPDRVRVTDVVRRILSVRGNSVTSAARSKPGEIGVAIRRFVDFLVAQSVRRHLAEEAERAGHGERDRSEVS